ncbi:unnamed protein product [Arabidopsis thaliana]|uniref:(thale cress) hypothetical protein n=1 Tax=Arabidopsis thaliana TaxID=3702 RepID=A0A7G2EC65_ARATH|nr:unnamed protein product [Arabidopsis thaliana]
MEAKKSNKIREIVKLQQLLKKWRKQAIASKAANNNNEDNNSSGGGSKSIKFLKRTLSFTDIMEEKNEGYLVTPITAKQECKFNAAADDKTSYQHPSDCPKTPSHQPHNSPMCR